MATLDRVSVSRETKLEQYLKLLQRWGGKLNLTSARTATADALRELIEGCLCVLPHLPANLDRVIDLGSGQGFPAIPLAIETGVAVDLIEADRRKAAFLTTALAELGLVGTVHATRIEETTLAPARCVTARALAPLTKLIPLALPFIAPDGCGLFLKGAAAAEEIEALADHPNLDAQLLATARPPTALVKVSRLG